MYSNIDEERNMLTSEASCDNIGINVAVINLFCKIQSCAISP